MDVVSFPFNLILLHGGVAVNFPAFVKPMIGLPYLLGMLAIGSFSTTADGDTDWTVPGVFVGALALGAIVGLTGVLIPAASYINHLVAAVLILLGLALIGRAMLPSPAIVGLVAIFGLLYGHALGLNLPAPPQTTIFVISYVIGLLMTTAGLQIIGGLLHLTLREHQSRAVWLQAAGMLTAIIGASWLLTL